MGTHKDYTAFGETKSIGDWAKDPRCFVGYPTLANCIFRGEPMEKALGYPPLTIRARTAFGETKSLFEWSKDSRCLVPYSTLVDRMRTDAAKNWTLEDALVTPRRITGFLLSLKAEVV